MESNKTITLAIVDDNLVVRISLQDNLSLFFPEFVIFTFSSIQNLFLAIEQGEIFDLIILDGRIGNDFGPRFVPELRRILPNTKIIGFPTDAYMRIEFINMFVDGLFLKEDPIGNLHDLIRQLLDT